MNDDLSRVAILGGTGNLGYGLSLRLAKAGHEVTIGSRDADRATSAAKSMLDRIPGAALSGTTNEQAVAGADFVILAVPFADQATTLKTISTCLTTGQIVVDATVPLGPAIGGRPTQLLGVWQGSAAQQAQALVPEGVRVVSGLHTLNADDMADIDKSVDQDTLICGDRKTEKGAVTQLLSCIEGLRIVDAGKLEMSRLVESLTPLLIGINIRHKAHCGIQITGL